MKRLMCALTAAVTLAFSPWARAQRAPTASAAVLALDNGTVRAVSARAVDLDGDGDLDELHQVLTSISQEHCVAAMRTTSGWVAFPITGLGGDRDGRCIDVVNGLIVFAWKGRSHRYPDVYGAIDIGTATVNEQGRVVVEVIEAGDPDARAWTALRVARRGRNLVVSAPTMRRVVMRGRR